MPCVLSIKFDTSCSSSGRHAPLEGVPSSYSRETNSYETMIPRGSRVLCKHH